ncbi:hypothetical protein SAMN05444365_1124 [Micromonospora pattaloongensis]|uniref:Uncharacterized protein n=1 Tax=Micromonospora pattaloongensis TaxID=405436 RepID=A0A1H3SJR1_9ACTN|nr:hypothetical protein SAMN05444365_1124 [Micromonospora pattaloongensis]
MVSWWLGLLGLLGVLLLGYWPFIFRDPRGPEAQVEREHVRRHHRFVDTAGLLILSVVLLVLAVVSYLEEPSNQMQAVVVLLIGLSLGGLFVWRIVGRR